MNFKINENLFKIDSTGWVLTSEEPIQKDDWFYNTVENKIYKCAGISEYGDVQCHQLFFLSSFPNNPKNQYIKKIIGTVNTGIIDIKLYKLPLELLSQDTDFLVDYIDDKICRWSSEESEYSEYNAYKLGLRDAIEMLKHDGLLNIKEIDIDLENDKINDVLWLNLQ